MRPSWLLVVAALGVSCHSRSSEALQRFDSAQAMRWVQFQVAAGPRVPGTPGHQAIAEWLERELKARADSVEVQAFTHVTVSGKKLELRNILARFRPSDPNRILYVTHWDTRPVAEADPDPAKRGLPIPGANDGASGTAMLLEMADALKQMPPSVGVDLLFVDGEDYGSFEEADSLKDVLIGSRYFAEHLPAGYHPLFAVLWDMIGGRNQKIYQEGYSLDRAPEVVERVWRAAEDLGLQRMFSPLNGGYITDDHVPLIQKGIRAIDVIGFENYREWHHTMQDTVDKVSPETLGDIGRLALALLR
jgi:Zn-dependent M28 family amino/carboxypeptidase